MVDIIDTLIDSHTAKLINIVHRPGKFSIFVKKAESSFDDGHPRKSHIL